jgi:hypothetical protein
MYNVYSTKRLGIAASHLLTASTWVGSQGMLYQVYGAQSGTLAGFFPSSAFSPASSLPTIFPTAS